MIIQKRKGKKENLLIERTVAAGLHDHYRTLLMGMEAKGHGGIKAWS